MKKKPKYCSWVDESYVGNLNNIMLGKRDMVASLISVGQISTNEWMNKWMNQLIKALFYEH